MKNLKQTPETNFYFWLGRDAELESLMPDQFEERVADEEQAQEDYKTVGGRVKRD